MGTRTNSILIGLLLGAGVGALLGWLVVDADKNRLPAQRGGLQALAPADFLKIGVAVLTLAREFGQMLNKR